MSKKKLRPPPSQRKHRRTDSNRQDFDPSLIDQNTPDTLTDAIRLALTGVSTHEPIFLQVQPAPGMLHMRCYDNVATLVGRYGGRSATGWIVYEGGRGAYLKLVQHAVWGSPEGLLIDPTPSDEKRNLFLPDPDSSSGTGGESRYIALVPGAETQAVIAFCEQSDRNFKRTISMFFR